LAKIVEIYHCFSEQISKIILIAAASGKNNVESNAKKNPFPILTYLNVRSNIIFKLKFHCFSEFLRIGQEQQKANICSK
jgi:hypothetical protein